MDNSKEKQEVLAGLDRILEKSDIKKYSISKLPLYIKSLVSNEERYYAFLQNPYDELKHSGIDPAEVDIEMLTQFVIYAYVKHNRKDVQVLGAQGDDGTPEQIGETMNKKETEEGSNVNWENKTESTFWYEENVSTEGKRTSQKTKQKHSYRNKKLEEDGESIKVSPENFLRPDIRHLYFPAQPLVTPELVEKIKKLLP